MKITQFKTVLQEEKTHEIPEMPDFDSNLMHQNRWKEYYGVLLQHLIGNADREIFVAIYLNAGYEALGMQELSIGNTYQVRTTSSSLFKGAILANASFVIIGHNHPSGHIKPSYADKAAHEQMSNQFSFLNIPLVANYIVGCNDYCCLSDVEVSLDVSRGSFLVTRNVFNPVTEKISFADLSDRFMYMLRLRKKVRGARKRRLPSFDLPLKTVGKPYFLRIFLKEVKKITRYHYTFYLENDEKHGLVARIRKNKKGSVTE